MSIELDWYGAREQTHLRSGTAELYNLGESVRVFLVRLADKSKTDADALFHSGVPAIRSFHPTRLGLWCSQKQARQVDDKNGQLWEVVCNYSVAGHGLYPWQEPPVYAWSSQSTEIVVDYDIEEAPILNSAGCPFDPGVTATLFEGVLQVSKNQLDYSPEQALKYAGAVNKSAFYGSPKGFCMCTGIPGVSQWYIHENGSRTMYWSVQYNFAFRRKLSWQAKILDAGYMKKGSDGLIPITIAGREPSSPVPLDGDGQPLENPDEDDPHFLDFKIHPEEDFSSLGV